jgi:hypothetical protein
VQELQYISANNSSVKLKTERDRQPQSWISRRITPRTISSTQTFLAGAAAAAKENLRQCAGVDDDDTIASSSGSESTNPCQIPEGVSYLFSLLGPHLMYLSDGSVLTYVVRVEDYSMA